jgi:hypothetical protein
VEDQRSPVRDAAKRRTPLMTRPAQQVCENRVRLCSSAATQNRGNRLFPDASRSPFGAVAEMIGLMPMVREFEARLAADAE